MPDAARVYRPVCSSSVRRFKDRRTSAQRGYGHRWRKASKAHLAANPLCVPCKEKGVCESATIVDHIVPHKGDEELFWDESNWQSICKPCHDSKTAREDGGFGREVKKHDVRTD